MVSAQARTLLLAVVLLLLVVYSAFHFQQNGGQYISDRDRQLNELALRLAPKATEGSSAGAEQTPQQGEEPNAPSANPPPPAVDSPTSTTLPPPAPPVARPPRPPRPGRTPNRPKPAAPARPSASSCLTATPAAPGTPFPCASRIDQHLGHSFFKWSADEEKRKLNLLGEALAECDEAARTAKHDARPTHKLSLVGCTGLSGQWNRCWIVPLTITDPATNATAPTCAAGDHFDVKLDNAVAKIAVSRVFDLENGAYEIQFYVRKKGEYTFQIDKVLTHDQIPPAFNVHTNLSSASRYQMAWTKGTSAVPMTPKWPGNTETFDNCSYSGGVDVVPIAQGCDRVADPDRFLYGAWTFVGDNCDGVHCVGKLKEWWGSLDGWMWASDVCVMRVFSQQELELLFAKSWVVGWGSSTMKQPMANLLEYHLGRSVFSVFMEHLDSYKGNKKRKPNFFTYRRWDQNPVAGLSTTRMSMVWGGCPGLTAPPTCGPLMGLGSFNAVQALIGPAPAAGATTTTTANPSPAEQQQQGAASSAAAPPSFPTLLLADHMVWRHTNNITQFVDDTIQFFSKMKTLAELHQQPPPLIIWHHGPTPGNTADGSRAAAAPIIALREQEYMKDRLVPFRKEVVMIARDQITLPLHFGRGWVHFGVHYGASKGMCNTGHNRKGYEFALCLQSTWGDDAVMLAWLNAYHYHTQVK